MSTSAYLKRPLYIMLNDEETRVIAGVISDNAKVAPPALRYMDKPDYRCAIKTKRDGTNEHLYFYHLVLTDPRTRYKASYELVVSEKEGSFLRYRGMESRIFSHFNLNVTRECSYNKSNVMAGFLRILEEIKSQPLY